MLKCQFRGTWDAYLVGTDPSRQEIAVNDEQHNLDNPAASQSQQNAADPSPENPSSNQAEPASREISVEEALRDAGADVRKATEAVCRTLQREAVQQVKRLRESTVGDLVDGALDLVKKYPGTGVVLAALIGFFLGRSLRK